MTTANSSPTQCEALLEYLRNNETGITALEALRHLGIGRLAARVFELRRDGYKIKDEMVALENGKHVARYTLVDRSAKAWKCTKCGAVVVPSSDSVAPGYAFAWCGKCGKKEVAREVVQ
jgi:ribosomal protein L37AE/L43A